MRWILVVTLFTFSVPLFGQPADQCCPQLERFTVLLENDLFRVVPRTHADRYYTGGGKIEASYSHTPWLDKLTLLGADSYRINPFFSWGFTTFTPRGLRGPTIDYNDRPYAGYSFFSLGKERLSKSLVYSQRTELFVGFMGANAPGKLQNFTHQYITPAAPHVVGWDSTWDVASQRSRKPLAISYSRSGSGLYARTQPVANGKYEWAQVWLTSNLTLGNYLTAGTLGTRFNLINLNNPEPTLGRGNPQFGADYNTIPKIFLPEKLRSLFKLTDRSLVATKHDNMMQNKEAQSSRVPCASFSFYVHPRIRAYAWNASLQWQEGSPHYFTADELNFIQFETTIGFLARYRGWQAGYTWNLRTAEFKAHPNGFDTWGGIFISRLIDWRSVVTIPNSPIIPHNDDEAVER